MYNILVRKYSLIYIIFVQSHFLIRTPMCIRTHCIYICMWVVRFSQQCNLKMVLLGCDDVPPGYRFLVLWRNICVLNGKRIKKNGPLALWEWRQVTCTAYHAMQPHILHTEILNILAYLCIQCRNCNMDWNSIIKRAKEWNVKRGLLQNLKVDTARKICIIIRTVM